ncbi:MAG: hypothetical protein ABII97_00060, partial [Patescibacteria group bacterium]
VYIKITGGEPFIRPDLLEAVVDFSNAYKDRIYKTGIGSNGSIPVPDFFSRLKIRTHIFLSRHDLEDTLPTPSDLAKFENELIDFRLNCNLIKGGVDSVEQIERYIQERVKQGITHFCFRELSKVDIDVNLMYPKQIYEYIEYYKSNLVPVAKITDALENNPRFTLSRVTGNYYDINKWYWYTLPGCEPVSVKFRTIDETRLIEYNQVTDGVDEYVIHPDGTLTGCWDKDMKIIKKGGE